MEFLSPYLGDIWIAIRSPFLVFLDPATILYWPYLLSAGIFALAVPMIIGRRTDGSVLRALKAQFAKRIWWAASSKADYRYYIINSIIFPAILAPAILSSFWVGEVLSQQLSAGLGARLSPATDPAYLRIAYTILFFLAYDLGRFLDVEVRDSQTGYLVPARDTPGALPDLENCRDAVVVAAVSLL